MPCPEAVSLLPMSALLWGQAGQGKSLSLRHQASLPAARALRVRRHTTRRIHLTADACLRGGSEIWNIALAA